MGQKILKWGVPVFFFLLPWQTIWILQTNQISDHASQFAVIGLYATEILLLLLMFFFGQTTRRLKINKKYRRPFALLTLVMMVVVFSLLFSINHLVSVGQAMHFVYAWFLFSLLLDERVDMNRTLAGFVAGLVLPAVLGIAQFIFGGSAASTWLGLSVRDASVLGESVLQTSDGTRWLRAYGSFAHPNIFAGYLAVGIAAIFVLWERAKTQKDVILLGLAGALQSVALVLTFSRSAWLGLLLALIVGVMVWKMKPTQRAKKMVVPIVISFIGVALLFTVGTQSFNIRPGSDYEFEARSVTERVEQYQEFSAVVGSRWLLGSGPGTYPWAIERIDNSREWWEYQPIHNVPLLLLAELGIIGLLAVLAWLASIDKINFKRFPRREAVGAFMMGNIVLVIAFFDHYLWTTWSGLALVALVMAMTVRLGED